jgi:hypothetical protein
MAGTAAPALDDEGKPINPHIPGTSSHSDEKPECVQARAGGPFKPEERMRPRFLETFLPPLALR